MSAMFDMMNISGLISAAEAANRRVMKSEMNCGLSDNPQGF